MLGSELGENFESDWLLLAEGLGGSGNPSLLLQALQTFLHKPVHVPPLPCFSQLPSLLVFVKYEKSSCKLLMLERSLP